MIMNTKHLRLCCLVIALTCLFGTSCHSEYFVPPSADFSKTQSPSGKYNACLTVSSTHEAAKQYTLSLDDSKQVRMTPANDSTDPELQGAWSDSGGSVGIKLGNGMAFIGYFKDDVMALSSVEKKSGLLLAVRVNATNSASNYTTYGAVYDSFDYNFLGAVLDALPGADGGALWPSPLAGQMRVMWDDEALRFTTDLKFFEKSLDERASRIIRVHGDPSTDLSGTFRMGIDSPAGTGVHWLDGLPGSPADRGKQDILDLFGATAADGSLFFAFGRLALPSAGERPLLIVATKRTAAHSQALTGQFRVVSGGRLPTGATMRISNGRWVVEAEGKTVDSGTAVAAPSSRSLFILRGDASNPRMVAEVDSTGRLMILQERLDRDVFVSVCFQIPDVDRP